MPYTVKLRYFAILREQRGLGEETLSTAAATPLALYQSLAGQYGFTLPPDRIQAAINNRFCPMDTPLVDGDSLVFVPPVAGG